MFGQLNWIILFLYLGAMLGLGYRFSRKDKSTSAYFKANGNIPWWAAGLSIYATLVSSITYISIPAKAYATNWTYFPMLATIVLVSIPVIRYYLPFFRSLQSGSAYQYLETRFNYKVRFIASMLFIIFMLARVALVLYVPALALSAVAEIDINVIILIIGLVTLFYATLGGIKAVIWGDVIQGIILISGIFLAAIYLITNTQGGLEGYLELGKLHHKFQMVDWDWDFTKASFIVILLGGCANNLISLTSDQTVIQRYMTTSSLAKTKRSIILNGIFSVTFSILFYVVGTGLYTFYSTNAQLMPAHLASADTLFPYFITHQLPQGLAGVVMAALLAATMSTVSSSINSISNSFTEDILLHINPASSSRRQLHNARIISAAAGCIGVALALVMATWNIKSLVDYFNIILGMLTSGLGALFFIGIFMKSVDSKGAILAFVISFIVVVAVSKFTAISFLLYGAIGFGTSLAIAYVYVLVRNLWFNPKTAISKSEIL
ncbi:MAG: sodium:solute symporter [Marinifilaceae bacterium]